MVKSVVPNPAKRGNHMEHSSTKLQAYLAEHFGESRHRLAFMARFILSLITVKTVNLTQLALAFNGQVKSASNYRRIQRFFEQFSFDKQAISQWLIAQLPKERLVLCLDRTNWKFGKVNINILALGVAYQGTAIGLLWVLLPKFGNSNQAERIELFEQLLSWLPVKRIKVLLADREFIGFLIAQKITFHIRLRENMLAELQANDTQHLRWFFADLKVGQRRTLHRRYHVCGHLLAITGMRLEGSELLIIVTNGNPKHSLCYYAQRWEIEMLFSALKTTGFDLEATHLTQTQRIDTLLVLLMLALIWSHRIGETLHVSVKPLKRKKHGHLAQSFFRYGLDYFRSILLHLPLKQAEFRWALGLLSCT
jgi:Transposase DDE domain